MFKQMSRHTPRHLVHLFHPFGRAVNRFRQIMRIFAGVMSTMSILLLATLLGWFGVLYLVSRLSGRETDNDTFFRAGRQSPWWMVGFGMIGASISGVSFISVPGWVASTGMTYLQMCAGFFFGYLVVAFVLLPLYYRLRLTSIYAWLGTRFGRRTRRTGALFFILSKLAGAAARLYLVCLIILHFILPDIAADSMGGMWAFILLSVTVMVLIWLYTRRSGIKAIVRTDALQTLCLLLALVVMMVMAAQRLGLDFGGVVQMVSESDMSRLFDWDIASRQNFWRQFLSGVFIVIVMTGLDQDMMQKNLTCRNLHEAQKNMCLYGACFLPVNLLLLAFGILLYALSAASGIHVAGGDSLLPSLVGEGVLGVAVMVPFTIGIVAAAFSSADSALTALTTATCIDLLAIEERTISEDEALRIRRRVHVVLAVAFVGCMAVFKIVGDQSLINAIYVMASYTYGPLLGLYAFGLFTRRRLTSERWVPAVCLASPVVCGVLDYMAPRFWGFSFGYELLMLNGLLTFAGLAVLSRPRSQTTD